MRPSSCRPLIAFSRFRSPKSPADSSLVVGLIAIGNVEIDVDVAIHRMAVVLSGSCILKRDNAFVKAIAAMTGSS